MARTSLAATSPEPTITARAATESRGRTCGPPVLGRALAEAEALPIIALALGLIMSSSIICSSPMAEAEDIAEAEDMAEAEALELIMSSSII